MSDEKNQDSSSTGVKEQIASFWNMRAPEFDESPSHISQSEAETAAWRDILLRLTGGKTGLSVLDVGTGTGFLALLLAKMGQQVTGIDTAIKMMDEARLKAQKAGLEITLVLADAEKTGLPDNRFDLVISRHVLWNMANPDRAVAEWRRVIRPGGTVSVIDGHWDPDKSRSRHKELWGEKYIQTFEKLPMYGGASSKKVSALFEEKGLVDVQVHPLDDLVRIKTETMPDDMKDSYARERYLVSGKKAMS